MAAGTLRARIRLERRQDIVQDGYGNQINAGEWETVIEVPARIKPSRGREVKVAAHEESHVTHTITIRHTSLVAEVDEQWRAVNARTADEFNIIAPANMDERKRYLTLFCTKGKAS